MINILLSIFFLFSNNIFFSTKKIPVGVRQTKNIYNTITGNQIGKNVQVDIFEGEGELLSIYFGNNLKDYIKFNSKNINKQKKMYKEILLKYDELEKSNVYDKSYLEAEKDKEIQMIFKDLIHDMEIYFNGKKYNYKWGYEIATFYVYNDKGEKIIGENAIDYISQNSNELKNFLDLWICDKTEGAYFTIDIGNENCKNYEYKEEYFPCLDIETDILINCDFWNSLEMRKPKNRENVEYFFK